MLQECWWQQPLGQGIGKSRRQVGADEAVQVGLQSILQLHRVDRLHRGDTYLELNGYITLGYIASWEAGSHRQRCSCCCCAGICNHIDW